MRRASLRADRVGRQCEGRKCLKTNEKQPFDRVPSRAASAVKKP